MNLKEFYLRARGKEMSEDFSKSYSVRDMNLREEIENLKEYNVPEEVIERMLKKHDEMLEWHTERIEEKRAEVHKAEEKEINRLAVIDALGDYLTRKNSHRYH